MLGAPVFPVLARAGVERASLQLAWDFTTATEDDTTGLIHAMRDALYDTLGEAGPSYTVDGVDSPGEAHIARTVRLTVAVPSFLEPPDARGLRLVRRGPDGRPVASGTEPVAVEIHIPDSVVADAARRPAPVVQYGHGLFWSREEARQEWLREVADREGIVIVGLDMEGMSEPNIGVWGAILSTDLGQFPRLAEWPAQGVMNHLAVQRLVRGRLAQAGEAALMQDGQSVFDPTRLAYYGNSQGGTLGADVVALSRDVTRGVLGVPGCTWSYLIHKSVGFNGFSDLIRVNYPDAYEFAAILGLVQTGFDRVDAANLGADLAGPDRRVLLQVAKEDATVDNQVSFRCGRSYGATLMLPAVREVWGLATASSPLTVNALTEFDFGHPDNPDPFAPAPRENDTHEDLRRLRAAQDQWVHFVLTGEVVHGCSGVCDPE